VDHGQDKAAIILGDMYWNGDGVERDHAEAARFWLMAAAHANRTAPAQLGRYYYAAAFSPDDRKLRESEAIQAAYWNTVASLVDPDTATRARSQRLAEMLLHLSPNLRPKVEALLASAKGSIPQTSVTGTARDSVPRP
jgi:TPR repeat protein